MKKIKLNVDAIAAKKVAQPSAGTIEGFDDSDFASQEEETEETEETEESEAVSVPAFPKPTVNQPIAKEIKAAISSGAKAGRLGGKEVISEWTGRDVFVAFPCYKHTNPVTAWTLLAAALDLGADKIRFDMEIGDAMIYHARNRLAEKFLASGAKWLIFLDDDMVPPIGRPQFLKDMCRLPADYPEEAASLHFVRRLVNHQQDIVGASYFSRHVNGRAINSLNSNETYRKHVTAFRDGILPCDWVGTGCLMISRRVFTEMQTKFPELAPQADDMPWNFFQPMTDGRGEDIAFCARAIECGFQPYVDTMLHAIHVGYATYGVHTARMNDLGI